MNSHVPESERWGKKEDGGGTEKEIEKEEENYGLSGALGKDAGTGNTTAKGTAVKYNPPSTEVLPNTKWRLYVFKPAPSAESATAATSTAELVDTLHIHRAPHYLIGSDLDLADIPARHASVSGQHAVLQYRQVPYTGSKAGMEGVLVCKPYIIDLESTHGTFLNGVKLDAKRYVELRKGDVVTFGGSTREYVLLKE